MRVSRKTYERLSEYLSDSVTLEQIATYLLIRYIDLNPVPSNPAVHIAISPEVERAIGRYVLSRHGNTIIKQMLDYLENEIERGRRDEEEEF